jgi:hypothetical protein
MLINLKIEKGKGTKMGCIKDMLVIIFMLSMISIPLLKIKG